MKSRRVCAVSSVTLPPARKRSGNLPSFTAFRASVEALRPFIWQKDSISMSSCSVAVMRAL